jgi:hypothetical protein
MVTTITSVLNVWNEIGVFSYVIPFLLIFAIVYAILKKTGILGDNNDGILAIISVSVGLASLQFDFVSEFFAVIFPRFGVGLSLFLVLLIMVGFFFPKSQDGTKGQWIGIVIGAGVVIWSLSSWKEWTNYGGFGGWFTENIWMLVVLGIIIAIIAIITKKDKSKIPTDSSK